VAGRGVIRLGNVWSPTLTVYKPSQNQDTGASVLVCPGGGYHILALDLEGTEVCQWLNSIGVTGVLLKYRVPRREGREKHAAALQDAQRALGLMRQNADSWGLDPRQMGVLGFSAGGHLAAALSNNYNTRSYSPVDAADQKSCRPDFTILVYPGYLTQPDKADAVAPELPISTNTPPTWTVITQDDPVRVENALGYLAALQRNKVPVEFHLFPKGGHGYGLRRTEVPVTRWTDPATEWLQQTVLRKR
jgi:acetyl esterase/lipase